MEIAEFVKARLDEDHWEAYKFHNDAQWSADMLATLFRLHESDPMVHHVARYDADRALREVAAKRAILARHQQTPDPKYGSPDPCCLTCLTSRDGYQEDWRADPWPCETIRQLAAVYSAHPDYRAEWKP